MGLTKKRGCAIIGLEKGGEERMPVWNSTEIDLNEMEEIISKLKWDAGEVDIETIRRIEQNQDWDGEKIKYLMKKYGYYGRDIIGEGRRDGRSGIEFPSEGGIDI